MAIFSIYALGVINVYSNVNVGSETPYIEKGATHSRLDKVKGIPDYERTNNGSWEIVNNHVGDWEIVLVLCRETYASAETTILGGIK